MTGRIAFSVFAAVAVSGLAACGQNSGSGSSGQASNVDTDSPAYAAMEYRQGLMHVLEYKAARLRGMADGNIPVNEAEFVKSASDLAAAARMLDDAFPEGSDSVSLAGVSKALPDIWNDMSAFSERRATLQSAAQTIAAQAQSGGFAAAQAAASEQIGPACGGCHRPYRQRAD